MNPKDRQADRHRHTVQPDAANSEHVQGAIISPERAAAGELMLQPAMPVSVPFSVLLYHIVAICCCVSWSVRLFKLPLEEVEV